MRNLYPKTLRDRIVFWIGIGEAALLVRAVVRGELLWSIMFAAAVVLAVLMIYIFPDRQSSSDADEYTAIISQIRAMGSELANLNIFLERERKRVADTQSTLERLQAEKTRLEPIVLSNKETVEAILAASAARVESNAWKERLFGFALGLAASLSAAVVYDVFRR